MGAIRTMNLMTKAELLQVISDADKSIRDLQPYNGTGPGARAISEEWKRRDAAKHELALRDGGL